MSRFILLGVLLALSVAATAQNVVSLANGVKVSAEVQQGAYNYYSFEIGDIEFYQQLKIGVVPSSGRSGLYAAYGVLPNATAYTWSATGSDRSITLKPTSPGFRKGTLLFSVSGVDRTFYDILVESGSVDNLLYNGMPLKGSVVKSFYTYYSFAMTPAFAAQPMVITVTGVTGDPDLYVSPGKLTTRPSSSRYTWRSTAGSGFNEVITILPKDPNYNTDVLFLAVAGLQPLNNYTITVTVGTTSTLINGLPLQDSTDTGICKYYEYPITADRWNQTLTADVKFNFGRAGLFAALANTRPDPYHTEYFDNRGDYRRILLDPSLILQSPSTLYISVCGDPSTRVEFTITVTSGDTTAVCPGMPVPVTIAANRPAYLFYNLDSLMITQGVQINASLGNEVFPDTYASFKNSRPSALNWNWKGPGSISIPANELAASPLNLGLWSNSDRKSYTLQMSPASQVTRLVNGTSARGQLETAGSFSLFSISINPFDTLAVVMTFRTGKANLYVSNVSTWPYADCTTIRWTDFQGDYRKVTISPNNGGYTAGNYNIVVVSTTAVVFDITATITSLKH